MPDPQEEARVKPTPMFKALTEALPHCDVRESALRLSLALRDDPAIGSEELARDIQMVLSRIADGSLRPATPPHTGERRGLSEEDRTRLGGLARENNPHSPLSPYHRWMLTRALALIDQYEAALVRADKIAVTDESGMHVPASSADLDAYRAARTATQEGNPDEH
jgi:hypothetical protein